MIAYLCRATGFSVPLGFLARSLGDDRKLVQRNMPVLMIPSVLAGRIVCRAKGWPCCGRSALVECDGVRYVVPAPRHTLRRVNPS